MRRAPAALLLLSAGCWAADQHTVDGPSNRAGRDKWLQGLVSDKAETIRRIGYQGGVFDTPALRWTQTSYIQPQMHPYDLFFYDAELGNYTVKRYLDDLKARYGGIDALLMWPTYTNIGIDDRDQFDLFRAMPGGLDGVKRATQELHDNGVKVLWPYNPWDQGTRKEKGGSGTPKGYHGFVNANCYSGHGGTDIDGSPVTDLTEAECTARCDADSQCSCVTYGATYNAGSCWKRKNCDPSGFDYDTGDYQVYMKPQGDYYTYPSRNAYHGFGGENIDVDGVGGLSVAQCKKRCDADQACSCVTYRPGDSTCWKRSDCLPGNFDGGSDEYTVYLNGPRALSPGRSDAETWARLLKETGGDGFNGDTMGFVPKVFWRAAQAEKYPLAFEPEGGGNDAALNWSTMGWGYWSYPKIPVVDRFKFITSGKFMTNVCDRWAKSKTDNLQSAWFNGCGYESWENVWGTWNGVVPRDGEAIRRVAAMLRYFGKEGHLQSPQWDPHTLDVQQDGAYGSKWPTASSTLWTLVNRAGHDLTGAQLTVTAGDGRHYYDCYHGEELTPARGLRGAAASASLSFTIEKDGYGCVLETSGAAGAGVAAFLKTMKGLTASPLASYSGEWKYELQTMLPIPATRPAARAPAGTVHVPKASFAFKASGVEIEGDDQHGVGEQYPWESHPQRAHSHTLDVGPFYIDKFPVTCANYSAYLRDTGFRPKDTFNWLKNWKGSTSCPAGMDDIPVTYVSIKEARGYCSWAGARLPHVWEWQYAAQGTDGRTYPWGNQLDQNKYPLLNRGLTLPGAEAVTAHAPGGDSPFGVSDLIGNVWQYTSEFRDNHTRYSLLRGGANYRPIDPTNGGGTGWYFPEALELGQTNKYFLMDDRYERAGTVGFRCVVDAA